jgi:hypothetical protein
MTANGSARIFVNAAMPWTCRLTATRRRPGDARYRSFRARVEGDA